MIYDRKGVARRIRTRRKELHLSIADVAAKIGRAPHYYGDIERGTCGMSIDTLMDLADCLNLTADYILYGEIDETETATPNAAYRILKKYDETTQKKALEMLKFYLELGEKIV